MARNFVAARSEHENVSVGTIGLPITLAAWVRPTGGGGFVLCYSDHGNGHWLAITAGSNSYGLQSNDSAGGFGPIDVAPPAATGWHLLTGVFTSSTLRALYIGSALVGTNTTSSPVNLNTLPMLDIATLNDPSGPRAFYDGWVRNPTMYSVALAPNDIAALAAGVDPVFVRRASIISSWDDVGRDRVGTNHMTTVQGRAQTDHVLRARRSVVRAARDVFTSPSAAPSKTLAQIEGGSHVGWRGSWRGQSRGMA